MKFKVFCSVHKKTSKIKQAYINSIGFLEIILDCRCHVFFELKALPQQQTWKKEAQPKKIDVVEKIHEIERRESLGEAKP